jgi:3-phenylpropionate/cinnamic acid dioxygenase small subunit
VTAAVTQDPAVLAGVSAFLFHEAQLLDERRFEEWLELFTEDAIYWVPQGDESDHLRRVSIAYDDRRRLHERVLRLLSGFAFAQDPPSRTCHVIGNVRIVGDEDGALGVASNVLVAEARRNVQTLYAGHVEHRLVSEGDGYKIRRKVIRLVNSDVPLGNVSFLL